MSDGSFKANQRLGKLGNNLYPPPPSFSWSLFISSEAKREFCAPVSKRIQLARNDLRRFTGIKFGVVVFYFALCTLKAKLVQTM
jgi:hypothetical protein